MKLTEEQSKAIEDHARALTACPTCKVKAGDSCIAWDYKRSKPSVWKDGKPVALGVAHEDRFQKARRALARAAKS